MNIFVEKKLNSPTYMLKRSRVEVFTQEKILEKNFFLGISD